MQIHFCVVLANRTEVLCSLLRLIILLEIHVHVQCIYMYMYMYVYVYESKAIVYFIYL